MQFTRGVSTVPSAIAYEGRGEDDLLGKFDLLRFSGLVRRRPYLFPLGLIARYARWVCTFLIQSASSPFVLQQ